jgi:RES domain-containing protein
MIVYRMHRAGLDALDSTGSFLRAGRWHSAGTRVIYAAEHVSLAALETLIHASNGRISQRQLTEILIPDDVAVETTEWREMPDSQRFGDAWVKAARTPVLRVPSIVVNQLESNFVVNPKHEVFGRVRRGTSRAFVFDERFFVDRIR